MSTDLLNRLLSDPNLLIHQIDPVRDAAAIASFSADEIRNAAFLDQRILTPTTQGAMVPWADAKTILSTLPKQYPAIIFHIGHCGSTLISKLVEAAGGPRGLREPLPMRTFAMMRANAAERLSMWREEDARDRFDLFLRSCAKAPSAVKATSFCNNLMANAAAFGAAKQAFITIKADAYIATMLGAENNIHDLFGSIELRMRRLRVLCSSDIGDLAAMSHGEIAAAAWASETATAAEADTAKSFDFEEFLAEPADRLFDIVDALGGAPDSGAIAQTLEGPIMRQYSKAPEHEYGADLRKTLLAEYARIAGDEISRGRLWLETQAKQFPPIAIAIDRFG
ncbi:MAG: hypothetical protein HKN14_10450 [Marinicaulis sp.]|nr:hypothetical protein [Marinicaulis sp.]